MKFRTKIYIITLMLFIFCISVSFLLILTISNNRIYGAETEKWLAEQHSIAQVLSNDAAAVASRRYSALRPLCEAYVDSYARQGVYMAIVGEGEVWKSTLPLSTSLLAPAPEVGLRVHELKEINGVQYIFITAKLPNPDTITLICAFEFTNYRANTQALRQVSLFIGIGSFAVLALLLFITLTGLSRPIEQLAKVTKNFASGNYDVRSNYKSKDEVGQLAVCFNDLANNVQQNILSLENAATEKQNLFDTLAHEIRTPITAVEGYAQYLQRAQLTEEERFEALQYIVDESTRLGTMCNTLLKMASLRGEKTEKKLVNLSFVAQKAYTTILPKAKKTGVNVYIDCPEDCYIYGEDDLLESLIINLVDNAIKACANKGYVNVSVHTSKESVVLSVTDTGDGMNEQTLNHLGEYFYRPDKARSRKNGGAGLGVSLCRQIAQSHGASIKYTSKINMGTSAMVIFTKAQK